jgi:two-component system, OmpR family, sensor kinase
MGRERVPIPGLRHMICSMADDLATMSSSSIRVDIDQDLHVDAAREILLSRGDLEAVLFAVMDNAVNYSYPDCSTVVQVRRAHSFLNITVSNTGLPLSATEVTHCFERGWRSARATAVAPRGNGDGLWIAKSILDTSHGSIEVSPTDDQGLTVVFVGLPLGPAAEQAAAPDGAPSLAPLGTAPRG